jgi:hypothetical protein
MRLSFGDMGYAYFGRKLPRRGFGIRLGDRRLVLRVSSWSVTDDDGDDWIEVLPLSKNVPTTLVNPHDVVWIPVDNIVSRRAVMSPESSAAVAQVLRSGSYVPRGYWSGWVRCLPCGVGLHRASLCLCLSVLEDDYRISPFGGKASEISFSAPRGLFDEFPPVVFVAYDRHSADGDPYLRPLARLKL